jgi:D-tyrosyl-tRNA(Tyr) deacylase
MRCVIQRVKEAKVLIKDKIYSQIGKGFLVFLGITHDDKEEDIYWMANKIINLRIFEDNQGKFNLSLLDINAELLIVSQFTLYANCKKGRRPSFEDSANPEYAKKIYHNFINYIKNKEIEVKTGIFGEKMEIDLINDGPVTIILDSPYKSS